jgi:subtilisin family serine protease
VGAVNIKGESSSFSERGINVAISAPGGEFAPPETIWTTNNSGAEANGILHTAQETSEAPEDYTDAFNGTSAAAPHVSGAAALLLEKYPSLGYRDVKEILMRSANRDPLTDGDPFVTNGGGIAFSHSFGAGLLNVSGALALANNWKNLGTLDSYTDALPEINKAIPDGSTEGVTVAFDLAGQPNLRVESVEFTVSVKHPVRGDLAFQLESPSGMKSLAQPRAADENADFTNYTFTTVRHWGESSRGVWKLTVADVAAGDAGTFQSASIAVYGTR